MADNKFETLKKLLSLGENEWLVKPLEKKNWEKEFMGEFKMSDDGIAPPKTTITTGTAGMVPKGSSPYKKGGADPFGDLEDIMKDAGMADLPVIPDQNAFPELNTKAFLLEEHTLSIFKVQSLNYEVKHEIGGKEEHIAIVQLEAYEPTFNSNNQIDGISPVGKSINLVRHFNSKQYRDQFIPVSKTLSPINPNHQARLRLVTEKLRAHALEQLAKRKKEQDTPEAVTQDSGTW